MLLEFITSTIRQIRLWWMHSNSKLHNFIKNFIVSIGFAWALSTFFLSLSGLAIGCILAFKLQTEEWTNGVSTQLLTIAFYIFVIILGLGVYLGIRAILMDITAKTKQGYRETFCSTLSTKDQMNDKLHKIENDIAKIKRILNKRE